MLTAWSLQHPHLPPILVGQGKGPEQGGAARAHSSCPQNIFLDPELARGALSRAGGPRGPGLLAAMQAAVWQLEVAGAACTARDQELAQGRQP